MYVKIFMKEMGKFYIKNLPMSPAVSNSLVVCGQTAGLTVSFTGHGQNASVL